MPDAVDQSLLDRLQALRGPPPAPTKPRANLPDKTKVNREDELAARLKALRATQTEDDKDALFQTDNTLEEMPAEDPESVQAVLDEVSKSAPVKDVSEPQAQEDDDLPSLPSDLDDPVLVGSAVTDLDDITARMAALAVPLDLPSVPSTAPAKRLTSRTKYTDEDADGWCTVCLEDATLQCEGCDDDVYCARCWREMHVGLYASFDDQSHRAVYLQKAKKKVAIGA